MLSLALGACSALDFRSGRIAEWDKGWEGTFAHFEITAAIPRESVLAISDAQLTRALGAPVRHTLSDWEVGWWCDVDVPRELDLAPLFEVLREWEGKGLRDARVQLRTDCDFGDAVAVVQETGQVFAIDWSPGRGVQRWTMLVRWPAGAAAPVLTPQWE